MHDTSDPAIYQLKVVLLGVSPMIWRRLLVRSDSTVADLHFILQIAVGWTDIHLHRFRIHGKQYGIARIGGIGFSDDLHKVQLADFRFRINERFFYEYDFNSDWQHQIRVEAILSPEPNRYYPVCINGRRTCPPEDCGGSWAFMALRQQYSMGHILMRLAEIAEEGDTEDYYEEIQELRYWAAADRFDRKAVNRRLQDYVSGNEAWMWE